MEKRKQGKKNRFLSGDSCIPNRIIFSEITHFSLLTTRPKCKSRSPFPVFYAPEMSRQHANCYLFILYICHVTSFLPETCNIDQAAENVQSDKSLTQQVSMPSSFQR